MDKDSVGVSAWSMQLNSDLDVAIGQNELVHIIHEPDLILVPKAPEYCNQVLVWNENIIPVINFHSYKSLKVKYDVKNAVVAVILYKASGVYHYGALILQGIPMLLTVHNAQACSVPATLSDYEDLFISCFSTVDKRVLPVLNTNALFGGAL